MRFPALLSRSSSVLLFAMVLLCTACSPEADPAESAGGVESDAPATNPLVVRAAEHELDTSRGTPWEVPPGDALEHSMSGFAKTVCSAIFVTGLDERAAAEDVGHFVSNSEERERFTNLVIDRGERAVHVTLDGGVTRTARFLGDQGCLTLPKGVDEPYYTLVDVVSSLPDATSMPWPMGDVLTDDPLPVEVDADKLGAAVDAAFEPADGLTAAFVVTHKGRIIGERYMDGIDKDTQLESWSMGKSLTATLMATLIHAGDYELWQEAPIDAWHADPDDPRGTIRIGDVMRMSSGLRFIAPQDPDYEYGFGYPNGYPDHLYVYTGSADSHQWAITRPAQWPPNTIGRYRNSDPLTINYLIRQAVEARGEEYLTYPQRALFDKIGIRRMVLETDPYGNFLLQGYEFGTGRNWARLGMLYLADGMANGERILPEGWVDYASTVAPAWEADGRMIYGGSFFWLNRDGSFPIPHEAFYMAGAGGQFTIIIPDRDMVVVRLGHSRGARPGSEALGRALELLMDAVPATNP